MKFKKVFEEVFAHKDVKKHDAYDDENEYYAWHEPHVVKNGLNKTDKNGAIKTKDKDE
jgi:hypothetical protein